VALDGLCNSVFAAGEYDKLWEACPEMFEEMAEQFAGCDGSPGVSESLFFVGLSGD
jgi:hypothetical protein